MKIVEEIRDAISKIDGAMCETPSELGATGTVEGRARAATVWHPLGEQKTYRVALLQHDDEISESSFGPELEELLEFGAELDIGAVKQGLGGETGDEIRRSIIKNGVDALAFYCSFHQRGTQWGIYIPATSLLYLAATVFDKVPADVNTKLQIAFRALHQHELFHFAVDYMVSQLEGILGRPCYVPARPRLCDPEAGYILIEEELANAHMIRALRGGRKHLRAKERVPALREFIKMQPAGYRDGGNSTSKVVFQQRSVELARAHIECIDGYRTGYLGAVELFRLLPIDNGIDWRYCPIHVVHDETRLAVNPITIGLFEWVRGIHETDTFKNRVRALPQPIQKKWSHTKEKIGQTTALPGLDFKRWKESASGRVYSVRVDRNYRAHLRYTGVPPSWEAIEIGTHRELGHG